MYSNWEPTFDFKKPGGSGSLSPVPTENDLVTLGGKGGMAFSGLPKPLLRRVPKFSAWVGSFLLDLESSLDGLMTNHWHSVIGRFLPLVCLEFCFEFYYLSGAEVFASVPFQGLVCMRGNDNSRHVPCLQPGLYIRELPRAGALHMSIW